MNPPRAVVRVQCMTTLDQRTEPRTAENTERAVEPFVAPSSGDMCRLSVVGPTSRVELAVPSHIPIVELLPTIVGHLDPSLATRGLDHGGWVLQRLGHPPLDEDRGTAAAGLLDGDVLFLRPRASALAEAQYDDVVDGVQSVLDARSDEWSSASTRRAALAATAVASLAAVVIAGGAGAIAPLVVGALALALVTAGVLVGRLWDDPIGTVLTGVGVIAAGVAGAGVPASLFPDGDVALLPSLSTGAAAWGLAAGAAAYARGGVRPVLLASAGAAMLTISAASLPLVFSLGLDAASAILVVLALGLARGIPGLAAWVGGLAVDPVPLSAAEFQTGLEAVPADDVQRRATVAHHMSTALWVAWSALLCAAMIDLALTREWGAVALTIAASVGVLLQARELHTTLQRGAVLVAASLPLAVLGIAQAAVLEPVWQILSALLMVIVAANACVLTLVLPRTRLAPTWGRTGDILHWCCAIAVPGLMLAVVGLFDWIADVV
ncbi:type VII secretion integral membrane protein EccD [uncultured Microbacterium sp.]|uniref:type VII secretion integral membrane protein EccD n=1 Tax=uncultured Microbacterium sp. TaxID=191216 RepID=UPI0025D1C34D|nr:type VII secretion integral membrane protein EccD [uncultured Microbacterium sp.]